MAYKPWEVQENLWKEKCEWGNCQNKALLVSRMSQRSGKSIDAWGRGYKKIREGFEAAGLPMPVVENFCGGVRVSFQRKNATENATDIATENATVKLNKTQEKIMAILHADKFATYDVIAKRLGVERTTVWRNIKKLQEIGRLRRIGGDNGGYWEEISH